MLCKRAVVLQRISHGDQCFTLPPLCSISPDNMDPLSVLHVGQSGWIGEQGDDTSYESSYGVATRI